MTNNFFALIENGEVRRISLAQKITASIRSSFIDHHEVFFGNDHTQIEFEGSYLADSSEVLYVKMDLPDSLSDVATNPLGIPLLNLDEEKIRTLFWYEDKHYYFQNFDTRKLLKNKNILMFDKKTYSKLEKSGFIVDNQVHAIFHNGKFFFKSYANGTRVFSLTQYFREATNDELRSFCKCKHIVVEETWLVSNSNSIIRKQITVLRQSGMLDTLNCKKVRKSAKDFKLKIDLDDDDRIVFPEDTKVCRDILDFLNERFYVGLLTGRKYKTNSNRLAN